MILHSMDCYRAQFGEDRLLAEHFGARNTGFYVEVGAYDGEDMSNTYFFESIGWCGILIEADPALAEKCRAVRPRSQVVNCAAVAPGSDTEVTFQVSEDCKGLSSLVLDEDHLQRIQTFTGALKVSNIKVPARTLDSILEEHGVKEINFMTIDVEGFEWEVLQGCALERWRPEILLLERNALFPDERIMKLLEGADYTHLRTTGVNDWFLRSPVGSARALSYRARMFITYYVPKYATAFRRALGRLKRRLLNRA